MYLFVKWHNNDNYIRVALWVGDHTPCEGQVILVTRAPSENPYLAKGLDNQKWDWSGQALSMKWVLVLEGSLDHEGRWSTGKRLMCELRLCVCKWGWNREGRDMGSSGDSWPSKFPSQETE